MHLCFYTTRVNLLTGKYENLPATVPAEQTWYNDVARAIYPEYEGLAGVLPETIAEGDHFTHSYEVDITSNVLEKENTELVVLLLDKNGTIVNADKTAIDGLTTLGISAPTTTATKNNVWYDLQGRRVLHSSKGLYIFKGKKVVVK